MKRPAVKRLKRVPAADMAISELRSAILTGALPPGRRLKPEELAEQMGVSRMPIRQALSLLEREGLVKSDRWRGTIVTPLDASLIVNIYQLRGILERSVAAAAARDAFDSSELRTIIAEGRDAAARRDDGRALELDLRFHIALYDAFGNAVISDLMHGLLGHVRRVTHAAVSSQSYRSQAWDEHEAIVDAIDARQPDRAAALAAEHIESASRAALRNLQALNGGTTEQLKDEKAS